MSLFFDYDLPEHLIAQEPSVRRDESRLLVLNRESQELAHHVFRDLPTLLRANDLLVLNDTKVLPARLLGQRQMTGGQWEGLFLREHANDTWELMTKTRGHPTSGEVFITDSGLRLVLEGRTSDHHWLMRPEPAGSSLELLAAHGHIPLPPYIRKGREQAGDRERYQTVYAAAHGSVAAPTAGLHFTPELLTTLTTVGVRTARVTLHVGLGTFAPVKVEDPTKYAIHAEWCEVSSETVTAIEETKSRGGRVIAVGTTTTRTLESAARPNGLRPFRGDTGLFIHPPFEFRVLDGLITNFHLPRTTLLLLAQAFAGSELMARAYHEAIAQRYRFYSYGDAMLIL